MRDPRPHSYDEPTPWQIPCLALCGVIALFIAVNVAVLMLFAWLAGM